jgi:hypothetical protein
MAGHGKRLSIRDSDIYEGTIKLIGKNRLTAVRCIIGSVLCENRDLPPQGPGGALGLEHRAVSADQFKASAAIAKPKTAAQGTDPSRFRSFSPRTRRD